LRRIVLDDIVNVAAKTLIALTAFALVAKFVKRAALNVYRDAERG
jgi:hypothetical protein